MSDSRIIYLAGPMRGKPYFNSSAFDKAQAELESQGFEVISPAQLDREIGFDPKLLDSSYDWDDLDSCKFSLEGAVERDLKAIRKSTHIYMLRGWEKSKGSLAEKAVAEWLGLEVMYEDDQDILEEALRLTKGDRQAIYGPPDQDFARTAAIWTALKGIPFEAREVAMFMIAIKLSRETHQRKRDNAVDIAGYARCLDICNKANSVY